MSNSDKNVKEVKKTKQKIVKTDTGNKDGQDKCPKCGATEITLNVKSGKLRCDFCRHEFDPIKLDGMETDIDNLVGEVIGSGASNIVSDIKDILTLKCSSCGAEVVIDTIEAPQARCHWCRNVLSINEQVPNGAIPDVVLPFKLSKEEARIEINKFVKKRQFYANPQFKKEFTTENIMGVYLPYMIIDINAHAKLKGQGEHLIRRYTVGTGEDRETYYDAELYNVEREFDIVVEGLTIESSSDKLNNNNSEKTNNVINAIMPFDIENSVKWNANYLRGYTSEKRDTNIDNLRNLVNVQAKDIVRYQTNETISYYDRGVRWDSEVLDIEGQQWKAAYLPVWLYSYQQVKGSKKVLHYVAVNARTKETMGSVPIHTPKLLFVSFLVEICGIIASLFVDLDYAWLFWLTGIVYYLIFYFKYRNSNARHIHEAETKASKTNLKESDNFVEKRTRLKNSKMSGANNNSVSNKKSNIIFDITENLK